MMTIPDFLKTKYVKFGRIAPELDCWGLTRLARVDLFGRSLLPEFGLINPTDKPSLTKAADDVRVAGGFIPVPPKEGAIATAWRGRLCVHVGILVTVDGRLWVLETDENIGPSLTSIAKFEGRYSRVIYYAD